MTGKLGVAQDRLLATLAPPARAGVTFYVTSQRTFAGSSFYSGALARAGTGIEAGVALVLAARTGVPQ